MVFADPPKSRMTDWDSLQFCQQPGAAWPQPKDVSPQIRGGHREKWTALFRLYSFASDKSLHISEILQFVDIRPPMPQMSGFGGAPDIRRRKINFRNDVAMVGIFIVQQDLALWIGNQSLLRVSKHN